MDKGEREQKPEISKETSILQAAEEEWDTCAGKFLLGNPETMGVEGSLSTRPLPAAFLLTAKVRVLRFPSWNRPFI